VIQEVVDEFTIKRRTHGKPRLRWRVSRGPKRSLGWVPFTNQDIAIDGATVVLRGQRFCIWKYRDIDGKLKSGSFNRDARRRWYCNLVVAVERPAATKRQKIVGSISASKLWLLRITRQTSTRQASTATLSPSLRKHSAAGASDKTARSTPRSPTGAKMRCISIPAPSSTMPEWCLSETFPQWQIASGKAKATLDMSWSTLPNLLRYKCDHAGVAFASTLLQR
jgi:hypothetical protein